MRSISFLGCSCVLPTILQADEANLEPVPPPKADVIADGALAMVAGSDTAAAGLASLFYLLLSHPEKYKYLQAEIDAVYSKDEDEIAAMDSSRHGRLVYLNACLCVYNSAFPRVFFDLYLELVMRRCGCSHRPSPVDQGR